MMTNFVKHHLVDRPSPMGLLESLQPIELSSKTIFFNSMTK